MKPDDRRARFIVKDGQKYLCLKDMKDALGDPAFVEMCAVMLAVGHQKQDPWQEVVRRCLGCMLLTLSGEEKQTLQ